MTGRADAQPATGASPDAIEAVLLDIDGTLVDSNDAHAQAWSDAFREAGFEIGSETVRPLIGMGADKLLPKLTQINAESEEGKRLVERRREIFLKEYLPSVRPFPQARELLERMRNDGAQLVVATSAHDEELRGLLATLGADWLIDDKTTSSDAKRSKPDPDIVRVAVDKAGVGPERCVMLGDTPYDVEAATRSRVRIVGLRCGGHGDDELRGAAETYDDPKDLLARYDDSLLGRGIRAGREKPGARPSRPTRDAGPESEQRR